MSLSHRSKLHERRSGRNWAVALCLVIFMVLVTWLSLVKLLTTGPVEAFDHAPRSSVEVAE